ncbi:MAG TPA: DUF1905 domain-containing protein [Erythrobacter sp.]|uniref:DUF1905 domain-containing protein n=2 Tax=Qipengyuania citrea TaxID=225971 RepID=A0A6I4U646_9SPHN|nr:DUF1905 domain-containing protein [Qipengyuania citrea]MCZ4264581.1 DUF1905 domain-containing protein [Erythrobacter sp. G21629-S1]RZP20356.1 MAG: DUF1905 domain-containing protein [Erythrobacter sp.]KNH01702.1 hypothetical protein J121_841 [Qipengyuania citrea LAMA 915]MCD1589741.1 DUF1905 domain-containing protein [Qipengyuania citrea]MDQ0566170.1 hypothetical protein [Qipengyuania citrea]
MSESVSVTAPLWRWTAKNGVSWFFVTIEGEAGESLSATEAMWRLELGGKRGFRSLKVEACIGETVWQTSCFPRDEGGWMLPVKAPVRKAEKLAEGDPVAVTLRPV